MSSPYRVQGPEPPEPPMAEEMREELETQAGASVEWGHPHGRIVRDLERRGATTREAEQIVEELEDRRERARIARTRLLGIVGVALMVLGSLGVMATLAIGRKMKGMGQVGFVIARTSGDAPMNFGVPAFIVGVLLTGVSAGTLAYERRAAKRASGAGSSPRRP